LAFRRRIAVLSVIGLLSSLVAVNGASAGPAPKSAGPPSTSAAPGAGTAAVGADTDIAALVEPRPALPGPLPADPTAALVTAVTAMAAHVGIDVNPEAAIRAAHLTPGLTGRLALLLGQLQACQVITDRLIAHLPAPPGEMWARNTDPGPIPEAPELRTCAAKVEAGGLELKDFLKGAPVQGSRLEQWPVLRLDPIGTDDVVGPDYMLNVDAGGNDTYLNNAGGNLIDVRAEPKGLAKGCSNPAYDLAAARCVISESLLVDVAGNDTYGQMEAPEDGVDGLCTDDLLVRRIVTGGAGAWGVGVLIDGGGDDTYLGKSVSLGAGHFGGTGVLLDQGGNDHYSALRLSEGFGTLGGTGVLRDTGGNDSYNYYLPRPKYPGAPDHTLGAGGALDTGGICDAVSRWNLGSGFLGGVGILADDAGDDTYAAAPPAKHEPGASGLLRDTASMGFGDGGGFGIFLDNGGHDTYTGIPGRADGATVIPSDKSQGFFRDSGGGTAMTAAGPMFDNPMFDNPVPDDPVADGGFVTAWFTHFIPDKIIVAHGTTPRFFNPDLYGGPFGGRRHTITEVRKPHFDPPGPPRFDVTVDFGHVGPITGVENLKPGTYDYTCRVHPFMKGKLIVQ
jgi:plastocyanin